jgi:hypothetical protein
VCLSIDEPVLCADLTWRPAGSLRPGDALVAFEDETDSLAGRRYETTTVTANPLRSADLICVSTPAGSVRCTAEHQWLAGGGTGHGWHWVAARRLRPRRKVMRILSTWETDRSYEAGWLAGILDGEGCLGFKSYRNGAGKLTVAQVPGVVADQIDNALNLTGATVSKHFRPAQDYTSRGYSGHVQAQIRWAVLGRTDIMRILGTVRPARMLTDPARIWEGFLIRGKDSSAVKMTIAAIEPAGTGTVVGLTTTAGTYIGAGFAARSCRPRVP